MSIEDGRKNGKREELELRKFWKIPCLLHLERRLVSIRCLSTGNWLAGNDSATGTSIRKEADSLATDLAF